MKDIKKIASFILVIIAAFAIVYGFRAWNTNRIEKNLVDAEMVDGLLTESVNYNGDTYIIPPTDIYELSTDKDAFPTINEPKFDSLAIADEYLADDVYGVSIEVLGDHRFYSYQILNWHPIVNDEFHSQAIAITHCALCKSPQVFERNINGEEVTFDSTNSVYNNNLLLKDSETNGLWMQMRGTGVTNENIGKSLSTHEFDVMTWGAWKELYPDGEALSRETGFTRDYTSHPYENYDIAQLIYFPVNHLGEWLGSKWPVAGVNLNGDQIAFSHDIMMGKGAIQELVGGETIVGLYNFRTNITHVFIAEADGQTLTFVFDFENMVLTDEETGSIWNANGFALAGELEGTQLEKVDATESFYFCWAAQFPNSRVSGLETTNQSDAE